jgi:RNA polymerase sigma factor (sigma-70 family)
MSALPSVQERADAAHAGLLYERHAAQILRFCRARLSPQEAEDAVQHTFLNAYRSLRAGTVPRSEAAWLFAIAENVCRERRRSDWRRRRIEVVSDDGHVDEPAPERPGDELDGLADALSELTENQRRAILLREWQGLSYREIAAELELSEAAVETLLFRARRSLARKLERARGRAWSGGDLGSALAYGKSLLGGAAAKVAAATLVVAAGATVATPVLRDREPQTRRTAAAAAPTRQTHAAGVPRRHTARPATAPGVERARPVQAPKHRSRTAVQRPAYSRPRPVAAQPVDTAPTPPPPPPAAATAPRVNVPDAPVSAPPVPAPPIQLPPVPPPPALPPLPPLPPVPTLPSGGGVPQLPPVPPLPP